MGIIDVQGQIVGGQIWSKLEHIQDIMRVLISYEFKMNQKSLQPRIKYLRSGSHGFRQEDFLGFPIITLWELSVAMETRVPI